MTRISTFTRRIIDGLARGHAQAPLAGPTPPAGVGPFSPLV